MATPISTATSSTSALSDQDFLFSHLADYLDGELPPEGVERFDRIVQAGGHGSVPVQFQVARGKLQLALQSYYLKDAELAELRTFVQDPAAVVNKEQVAIEQIGRGEMINTLIRRLALVAIAAALVGVGVWQFGPKRESAFKPLEYLGYEALAMEEDPGERLNLPTRDLKEIRQYLANYPGLDFSPKVLRTMPTGWQPDGATVIDYEIAKVAVVQYENKESKEKLFHFTYAGELADLPKAEPGNMRGLIFQTYSSDQLNLIAWQSDSGVISLLVGRRSAPELAEIAVAGSAKN